MTVEPVTRYTLDCVFNQVAVCVLWNEWPIVERQGHGTQSNLLNPFVVDGPNVLRVECGPVEHVGDQLISVSLFKFEAGSDERRRIYHFDWVPRFGHLQDRPFEIARHDLHFRKAFGRWMWQDARPFTIQDDNALRAKVVDFRSALTSRDIDRLMNMSRLKMAELARATGRPGPAVEGVQRELFGTMFGAGVHVFHWKEEDLRFRSGAGGRLVRVRLADGNEPLSFIAGDNMVELPLVFSHLETGFELVR